MYMYSVHVVQSNESNAPVTLARILVCAYFAHTVCRHILLRANAGSIRGSVQEDAGCAWQKFQNVKNFGTTILFGNVREHFVNYAHPMRCLVLPVRADACPMA